MDEIQTKICTRCKKELPVTQFNRSSASSTGYASACKSCHAEAVKISRIKRKTLPPPDLSTANPKFADVQSRTLIAQIREIVTELKARGYSYKGELTYLQVIKL